MFGSQVSASWALDLEQYNEWMSEEDYEVDEQGFKKNHKVRLLSQLYWKTIFENTPQIALIFFLVCIVSFVCR